MNEKGLSRVGINLALVAILVTIAIGTFVFIGGGGAETAQGDVPAFL